MSNSTPITSPSGSAPAYAVGYSDPAQKLILVSERDRLPVSQAEPAPAALAGSAAQSTQAGPFEAVAGRIVSVALDGAFEGSVTLLRSTDGGATKVPLRVAGEPWGTYSAPGLEQAWLECEDGASFYLDVALQSGTVAYRVSQ